MAETSRSAQLELADDSLPGRRVLRRRRRAIGVAILSAAVVLQAAVVVSIVLALTSDAGHKLSKPEPAGVAVPQAEAGTAYVTTYSGTVVPISLATNVAGTPIKVPVAAIGGLVTTPAAVTPNGRTVYEAGSNHGVGTVTAIDTATNGAGPPITLHSLEPIDIAIAPNGKTAYVGGEEDVFPINTATNAAGKPIRIPTRCWAMAFTPDGRTLYVLNPDAGTVTPIRTGTNTALAPIKLPLPKEALSYLYDMAITPNGKTAYVVYGVQDGKPYANSVIPINLATNTALAPTAIEASGLASGLVIAPGGRTAYVLSSGAVTPIDTATNEAEPAINLPATDGNAYRIALAPNGKTIYVLTPRGVVPIRTASRTVLPMIKVPKLDNSFEFAITPEGKTIYVGAAIDRRRQGQFTQFVGGGVVPISTATNTAGHVINVGGTPSAITFAR